jgi:hypothetical protein
MKKRILLFGLLLLILAATGGEVAFASGPECPPPICGL